MQLLYRSGALRLKGDIKGKPHIVNGQYSKHYLAGQKFVGNVEEVSLISREMEIAKKKSF
jgi:hypothetical protein